MKRDSINKKIEFKVPLSEPLDHEPGWDLALSLDDIRTHFPEEYLFTKSRPPAELFCEKQYKGYYLRGQVNEMVCHLYYGVVGSIQGHAVYRVMILALLKGTYQERLKREAESRSTFGVLFHNTEKEYVKNEEASDLQFKKAWLRLLQHKGASIDKSLEESVREYTRRKTTLVTISMDEAEIKEDPYLSRSIAAGKEAVLSNIEVYLERCKLESDFPIKVHQTTRIYPFLVHNLKKKSENGPRTVGDWLDSLYDVVYFNFDYDYLDKRKYLTILENIGNLCHEWMKVQRVTSQYLRMLNKLRRKAPKKADPLTDFCWRFFNDLTDDLIAQGKIGKCLHCSDFFLYPRGARTKKYCSYSKATDGKNKSCAKRAANQRYYRKRRLGNLEKGRKT